MIKILLESKKHGDKITIIDKDRLFILSGKKMYLSGDGKYGIAGRTYIHRLIIGAKPLDIVDHINMDTFDNRLFNLRITDRAGNELNKNKRNGKSSSKYKGVMFDKSRSSKPWTLRVSYNNKAYHITRFGNESSAAFYYNLFYEKFNKQHFAKNIIPKKETRLIDLSVMDKIEKRFMKIIKAKETKSEFIPENK